MMYILAILSRDCSELRFYPDRIWRPFLRNCDNGKDGMSFSCGYFNRPVKSIITLATPAWSQHYISTLPFNTNAKKIVCIFAATNEADIQHDRRNCNPPDAAGAAFCFIKKSDERIIYEAELKSSRAPELMSTFRADFSLQIKLRR